MLRITAGEFKGRTLQAPASIRPTGNKVRQAIFNILSGVIEGARVLDGFAGSGALGFEALSRGASFVAFVDESPEAIVAIRENLNRLGIDRRAWRVVQGDILRSFKVLEESEAPFDVVLLDPPYRTDWGKNALNALSACAMLAPAGIVGIEHDRRVVLPESVGPIRQLAQHRYGATVLSFYQVAGGP